MTVLMFRSRPRAARRAVAGLLACGSVLLGATLHAAEIPADMPKTPFPQLKGCSLSQETYLKDAWRLAHYFTWRTDKLIDHIMSQSEGERGDLWERDYIDGSKASVSPRAWFGPYSREKAEKVRAAVHKTLMRFEMRGEVVKGIGTLRCGRPIAPANDVNVDKCPSSNPGSDGPPSAYHFPVGTVVTCEKFWDRVNSSTDRKTTLGLSARVLVHEVFHWLTVDGKYVTDYHGDGAKGQPDQKYYGVDNAMYLAQQKPGWAIYNNDNYGWFAHYVGSYEPTYSAVFVPHESSGAGGFYVGLTWDGLVERWKSLGSNQYLADVETYVEGGQRRYTAVWRVGKGNGALWASPWPEFAQQWASLKKTQDLIDVEIYRTGGTWTYLGVFRAKQNGGGDGGLFAGISWTELVEKRKEYADKAYLADVETYEDGGTRKFVAVWRAGQGNGALYWFNDWNDFKAKKKELDGSQQLVDFERFITGDGKWNYLGVWTTGGPSGELLRDLTKEQLIEERNKRVASATLVDVEEYTALPARVK
jgi:hypothetical protein